MDVTQRVMHHYFAWILVGHWGVVGTILSTGSYFWLYTAANSLAVRPLAPFSPLQCYRHSIVFHYLVVVLTPPA